MQCTTVEEVDHAVQDFWVKRVWRMHAEVDAEAQWQQFESSLFFHMCLIAAFLTTLGIWSVSSAFFFASVKDRLSVFVPFRLPAG